MSKALFSRTLAGLSPDQSDERSRFILNGIPLGTIVQVEITRPRSLHRHRFFWAMATHIADAIPGNVSAEEIVSILKIETGHCKTVKGLRDTYRLPKSIAFHNMDEAEFASFINRCCEFICLTWVPALTPGGLRNEIENMLGMRPENVRP